jgi:thiol:disulfide interchange protein DsbD
LRSGAARDNGSTLEPQPMSSHPTRRPGLQHWLLATLVLASALLALRVQAADDQFLEPEKAFRPSVRAADERHVEVLFQIAPNYYMYRERFEVKSPDATLGALSMPSGKVKFDETFQKEVETYRNELRVRVPVQKAPARFSLQVVSQGCADAGLCYPPMTSVAEVSLTAFGGNGSARVTAANVDASPAGSLVLGSGSTAIPSPGPANGGSANTSWFDGSAVDSVLHSGRYWLIVGAFFAMGLALSFTPCVLPMLPILSSIIAGSSKPVSRGKALGLAASYSLGMALIYTLLGVGAGLAGEGLAARLQTPAVLALFAAMLVLLALSMFDVYELRLPSSWSTRISEQSQRLPAGQVAGVFGMGAVSALIVSPCVSAPLAGALVFISQTRDVTLGGTALFSLAAGMSVPLLVVGGSAGDWLPKSGAWMDAVKRAFGVLLFGVAIWIVQPVLPSWLVLGVWGLLLLITGFMLQPFERSPRQHAPRVWLRQAAGVVALILGAMQIMGAASGGNDPLQPLSHWTRGSTAALRSEATPVFQNVSNVAELDRLLQSPGRPVMLDFYADWCVSCKEMERFTFTDAVVAEKMSRALLLKADVTANNQDDRELLKRFRLFGPPGTIFFDAQGREIAGARVVGFQNAERFAATLSAVGL